MPELAWAAALLEQELRAAADVMTRNAINREQLPDPGRVCEVLHRLCLDRFARAPWSRLAHARRDENGIFRLRFTEGQPIQLDHTPYDLTTFEVSDASVPGGAKSRVQVLTRDLGAAAKVLRLLAAGVEKRELLCVLEQNEGTFAGASLLAALSHHQLLRVVPRTRTPRFRMEGDSEGIAVSYLGHAGLLARMGTANVAVDPWFVAAHGEGARPPASGAELPELSAILVTHHHWDHIHQDSALHYPPHVPVIVPRQDDCRPVVPRYRAFLALFGSENVVELAPWEAYRLPGGATVTAIPFFGEGTHEEGWIGTCYLLEHGEQRVLVHVDSSPDSRGKSDVGEGVIARIVRERGPIAVVLASRRQELRRAVDVLHLLPTPLAAQPQRWFDVVEVGCCSAEYLAALAGEARCQRLVLYAEGGAAEFPDTNFVRHGPSDVRFAPHEFLWDDLDTIRAAVQQRVRGCRVDVAEPHAGFWLRPDGTYVSKGAADDRRSEG